MRKWTYKIQDTAEGRRVPTINEIWRLLEKADEEGWELVTAIGTYSIFRKPKK